VTTPFRTSIELMVLPTIGMITSINGTYRSGINAFPNIRFR